MKPQDVLAHSAHVLSEQQRRTFFGSGFLVLPDYVPEAWLERLRAAMAELARAQSHCQPERQHLRPRRRALAPHAAPASHQQPAGPASGVLAIHDRPGHDRPRRRRGRSGRQVPPRQAQREVGQGQPGLRLAPGHPGLATHRFQPRNDRHLHRRLYRRSRVRSPSPKAATKGRSSPCTTTPAISLCASATAISDG